MVRRRRRRLIRLTRTILVVVLFAVIAFVVARGGSSSHHHGTANATTTTVARAPTVSVGPTTVPPPTGFTIAHLPAVLPQPVSRSAVIARGGALIVLGGLHGPSPGSSTTQVLTVNAVTGAAQIDPPLALATHDAAAVQVGATVLVFGGGEATTVSAVQAWTPSGARIVGHLPQARSDIVAASVDGHGYVLGGFDGTNPTADVLETDDGVTFHVAATLPVPVRYPAVAVLGSTVYLIGGQSVAGRSGDGPAVTDVQAVDLSTGSAQVVSQLPGALTEAAAFVVRGAIFVAGGVRGGIVQRGVFRLDPATGALTLVASLPEPRADAGVAQVGDTTYLVGGEGPARLPSVVALQPA